MLSPQQVLQVPHVLFNYPLSDVVLGNTPVLCVGHMFDKPGVKTPRLPISSGLTAFHAYIHILSDMHDQLPISAIVTGGTHGGDSFAVAWALLNNVPLFVVRPYDDVDHLVARIPEGNAALTHIYRLIERIYQRAVVESRAYTLFPRIPRELWTADHLDMPSISHLSSSGGIPTKAIAETLGSSLFKDPYACYAWTNAGMLSLLSMTHRPRMTALWNGQGGNTPGGTEHAVRFARTSLMMSPVILTAGLQSEGVSIPMDLAHLVAAVSVE